MAMNLTRWRPSATIETLRRRAAILGHIRSFFNARGYLEVDTPVMAQFGVTDVYLTNIEAQFRGKSYYLQTSPEYHMKRLLAAGSGPIFQLARVFRDDELGRWHNPEFTLLEWYQLDIDHIALMDEVDVLLQTILACGPMRRQTYQHLFSEVCGFDPLTAELSELKQALRRFELQNVLTAEESDRDQYLFLLMSHVVEPKLANEAVPVAVYHFPPSQAALAQIKHGVAERFEVYFRGVELANGFHELTDAAIQGARFENDRVTRRQQGFAERAPDEYFLQALNHGLPSCSGVALGIDRLLALALEQSSLASVMAFDFSNA
ncbi:EF-P lysine aminoacylase GenX [Legionella oakridgensis ATCC 33761 = DSM 21215]|uniref:EF-P lysine aminoacylase GenX n=3 Tax=Legionella oakridgensis TaxID=29423 RepID=W0BHE0_9GAMM|nr:EF-P lysine aminoacylase GenX [Legionella oakridgensis ATCC 33761 = DSM 21215]KTD44064.1 lysyl-tRNA synthetase [Legionella oakridgensis]STY20832.1 lysyl-tRNA synthetase [Legionella longbeachae]